jgi:hypothetical protein
MLHLKRPRLFPVLDSLVAEMLAAPISAEAPTDVRLAQAQRLVTHLRQEGGRNLEALLLLQEQLSTAGAVRSLVRILDAVLWVSHPAAGLGGTRKSIAVRLMP